MSLATPKAARGNDCPRRGVPYGLRAGSSPEDETRLPAFGICRGSVSGANRARAEGRAHINTKISVNRCVRYDRNDKKRPRVFAGPVPSWTIDRDEQPPQQEILLRHVRPEHYGEERTDFGLYVFDTSCEFVVLQPERRDFVLVLGGFARLKLRYLRHWYHLLSLSLLYGTASADLTLELHSRGLAASV